MKDNYFNLLSADALIRVAELTTHEKTLTNRILGSTSPFRRVAPLIVKTIHLHHQYHVRLHPLRGLLQFGRKDELEKVRAALRSCGEGVRTVDLHSSNRDQLFDLDSIAYAKLIVENCPNVEKLILRGEDDNDDTRDTIESFVTVFASKIRSLEFRARRFPIDVLAIVGSTAIQNLQSAKLLRQFSYSGDSLGHLNELWGAVGEQLESIHIRYNRRSDWPATIASIQEHCRNLQVCMLHNPLVQDGVKEEVFADFICSFGTSLKYAHLHSLNEKECLRISQRCPNLRCEFAEKRHNFVRLFTLGDKIDKLHLRVNPKASWEKLSNAISHCTSLTTLKVHRKPSRFSAFPMLPSECVEALFASPRPHLEHLVMRGVIADATLDLLAQNTGNLRSLVLDFSMTHLWDPLTVLPRLVIVNRLLERVEFYDECYRSQKESAKYLLVCVTVFGHFRALRHLKILCPLSTRPDVGLMRALALQLEHNQVEFEFAFRPDTPKRVIF